MTDESPAASTPPSRVLRVAARRGKHLVTARPWLTALVALLLAGGIATAVVLRPGDDAAAATQTTTRLVAASTGTVTATVSTTGTIAAADVTEVSFGSAAEITSVKVAQGDTVTAGQVLGTIDTTSLKADLADARATLARAQSTLATAEDAGDTSDVQLTADEAAVTSAALDVTTARKALTAATLRSPIAGTVAEVNVTTGEQSSGTSSTSSTSGSQSQPASGGATGSSSTTSSTADFVVTGLKKWTVSATLDDTEVGLVKKDQQVRITTDNVSGTVFGTVTSVSVLSSGSSDTTSANSGTTTGNSSAGYPVEIAVTGSPAGLHDGASATLAIVYKQATNVLTVPTLAVRRDGTTSYVYVSRSGKKTRQTVTTGLASGGTTQISSGLDSSDQVYVETVTPTGGSGTSRSGTGTGTGGERGGNFGGGTGGFPGGGTGGLPAGGFPGGGAGGGNGQQGGTR